MAKPENNNKSIPIMKPEDVYKYSGYEQNRGIDHKKITSDLKQKFANRANKIVNTKLNSRNLTKAINTYAIPQLTYSFGIMKWSRTELEDVEGKVRTALI